MRRVGRALALALTLGLVGLAAGIGVLWQIADDPVRWHADPLRPNRTGRPNDYLVAPHGTGGVDRVAPAYRMPPGALMTRLRDIALAEPRTVVIASDGLHASFVQRSALFRLPDYISVRVLPIELDGAPGATLAIWSRARFGYGDFGVNKARVERWLDRLQTPGQPPS